MVIPTAAARTGLTTVTVASGAASPAPRYAAWESSSPVAASPAMARRVGRPEATEPEVHSTATVFVNTDAIPKATPAPVASTTLRSIGRRIPRARTIRAATVPKVPLASTNCSGPASVCDPALPVRASSPARPTVAIRAPRHAVRPALRRTKSAAIGSAKTIVRAPRGCTRLSGPYASATT